MSPNFPALTELITELREKMSASWHQSGDAADSFSPYLCLVVFFVCFFLASSPQRTAILQDKDHKYTHTHIARVKECKIVCVCVMTQ